MKKRTTPVPFALLALAGFVVLAGIYMTRSGPSVAPDFPTNTMISDQSEVVIDIPAGSSGSSIAQILFDTGTTSGSTTCIQCALNSSGYPYVVLNNSPALTSSIVVSTGTWTHVAWVRSSGTLVIYVNGVSGGSVANSTNISDTGLTIGTPNDWRDTSASYHYNGYIDDLRVTKGYARYTTTFTPPTSAFPTY